MTNAVFYGLWYPLLSYACRRGVDRDAAKDLVMEAIMKVVERYDPERGEMLHFAFSVLGNLIKNHFRETKRTGALPAEVEDDNPTPDDEAVMEEESRRAAAVLERLCSLLAPPELTLLLTLQEQMEKDGKCNVSKAARSLGITAQEGHNLLRKIQRKRHSASVGETYALYAEPAAYRNAAPPQEIMTESSITFKEERIIRNIRFMLPPPEEKEGLAGLLEATRGLGVFLRISERVKNLRA